jgi:hypothetical protein
VSLLISEQNGLRKVSNERKDGRTWGRIRRRSFGNTKTGGDSWLIGDAYEV